LVRVRRNHAVKTIDLELEEREIVTVQGANGTRDIVDGISDDQLRTWTQAATMAIGLLFIGRALVLLTDAAGSPS
jgi:succinate dehydrogenase hydrophobic anchor subunit